MKTSRAARSRRLPLLGHVTGLACAVSWSVAAAPADPDPRFQARFAETPFIPWVRSLAVRPDGSLWVAGAITKDTIPPNPGLARLASDGSFDSTYQPALNGVRVTTVVPLRGGKTLIGGIFTMTSGEVTRTNLARLLPDGALDPTFDAGQFPADPGVSLLERPDGKLLVAGSFTDYQRTARSGIVRLHPDGALDEEFKQLPYSFVKLDALVPGFDGTVTWFGTFMGTDTGFPVRMVRILPDGSEDASFHHPDLSIDRSVGAAGPGGTLYVATTLEVTSPSVVALRVLRLGRDGDPDPAFQVRVTGSSFMTMPDGGIANPPTIQSMHRQPDGRLLIAGKFDHVNDSFRWNIARLEPDGSLDTSFLPGSGPVDTLDSGNFGYPVSAMVVSPNGSIYLVGSFDSYNRQAVTGIVRLLGDPVPRFQGTHAAGPAHFFTTWIGQPGEVVTFETSADLNLWTRWQTFTNETGSISLSAPGAGAGFFRATSAASDRP